MRTAEEWSRTFGCPCADCYAKRIPVIQQVIDEAQGAESVVSLLERLTRGQGLVCISVFDAGAGGGFQEGTIEINLERDGRTLGWKSQDRDEFVAFLDKRIQELKGDKKEAPE